jgi:hypothetical protein
VQQQQAHQEAELPKREISGLHCCAPLPAADAHADVCCLDHGHVVGAVADRQRDSARLALQQRGDLWCVKECVRGW